MDGSELVEKLQYNTKHFRKRMQEAGFTLKVHGTGLGLLVLSSSGLWDF